MADGHGRQPPRTHRDRGDQGGRAERGPEGPRPRDPGARRRRRLRRLPAGLRPTPTCARCGWPTGPTRCTSSRSRGASWPPTCPGSAAAAGGPRPGGSSPLHSREREPAGEPEGLLVLHHGRGADELDLLALADVLDPRHRLHVVTPRAPLQLAGFARATTGTWCPVSAIPTPTASPQLATALAALHEELWHRTGLDAGADRPGGLLDGHRDELRARPRGRRPRPAGVLAFSGFLPTVADWTPDLPGRARPARPDRAWPPDQVIDVASPAMPRSDSRPAGSPSSTTSPTPATTSTLASCPPHRPGRSGPSRPPRRPRLSPRRSHGRGTRPGAALSRRSERARSRDGKRIRFSEGNVEEEDRRWGAAAGGDQGTTGRTSRSSSSARASAGSRLRSSCAGTVSRTCGSSRRRRSWAGPGTTTAIRARPATSPATCTRSPSRSARTGRGCARRRRRSSSTWTSVARDHGVDPLVVHGVAVTLLVGRGRGRWTVARSGGRRFEADAVVVATGQLAPAVVPGVEGSESSPGTASTRPNGTTTTTSRASAWRSSAPARARSSSSRRSPAASVA